MSVEPTSGRPPRPLCYARHENECTRLELGATAARDRPAPDLAAGRCGRARRGRHGRAGGARGRRRLPGLFMLGGCGEGAWLTSAQRGAVVRAAVRAAAGRVPVLAGVMLPATGPAVEAARQAAGEGADALVVGSPYYFGVEPAAQERHVSKRARRDAAAPCCSTTSPSARTTCCRPGRCARLARDPRVLGIKDSAGDFEAFQTLLAIKHERPRFRVLQGHEALAAASLLQGGDGMVPGLANVVPAPLRRRYRPRPTGRAAAECAALQRRIAALAGSTGRGRGSPRSRPRAPCAGSATAVPRRRSRPRPGATGGGAALLEEAGALEPGRRPAPAGEAPGRHLRHGRRAGGLRAVRLRGPAPGDGPLRARRTGRRRTRSSSGAPRSTRAGSSGRATPRIRRRRSADLYIEGCSSRSGAARSPWPGCPRC